MAHLSLGIPVAHWLACQAITEISLDYPKGLVIATWSNTGEADDLIAFLHLAQPKTFPREFVSMTEV